MDLCYMVGENRRFLYVSVFYDMSAFYWCQLEYCMYHKDQDIERMLPLPQTLILSKIMVESQCLEFLTTKQGLATEINSF